MRQDLNAQTEYAALLGRRVTGVDAEARSVEVAYEARPDFANRAGFVAGGMLSAMLDSLTGLAALAAMPEGAAAVHTRLEVDYVSRARPGRLVGRARVTDVEGDTVRCQGELCDADGNAVARAVATLRVVG
jgi:uncharacterized protein (TIGR00369 family)